MFTFYKHLARLDINLTSKLGYEYNLIMEILNQFNILQLFTFFKHLEQHFNIPLLNHIITFNQYMSIQNKLPHNKIKHFLIINFLKIIKKFFLMDYVFSLISKIHIYFFTQKFAKKLIPQYELFKPLILGQVYGQYTGSVIPFYVHTSSWYARTGLFADVSL